MSFGTVKLKNAVFYAHHGVMEEEHRIGGRYEVDVDMELDFEQAGRTDSLSDTVDYDRIYKIIQETVTTNRFYLIERLAFLIASKILDAETIVRAAIVTVRKPNPPVSGPCDCAEVVYRASRSGSND
jgi:dihydroneopterin aldolase